MVELMQPSAAAPVIDRDALVKDELLAMLPHLRRLPDRVDRLLTLAGRGELRVRSVVDEDGRRIVRTLVNRALLAGIGAALLVVSAVLLVAPSDGPAVSEDTGLFEIFGYGGLLGGTVLVLRVVGAVAGRHDVTSLTTAPPGARRRPPVSTSHPVFTAIPPGDRYERHPGDVLRLVAWTISTVALVTVIETAERTTQAIDGDVDGWIDSIPESGRQLGRIAIAVVALLALAIVVLALVVRRRWRRLVTRRRDRRLAARHRPAASVSGLVDEPRSWTKPYRPAGTPPTWPGAGRRDRRRCRGSAAGPRPVPTLRRLLVAGRPCSCCPGAQRCAVALAVAVGNVGRGRGPRRRRRAEPSARRASDVAVGSSRSASRSSTSLLRAIAGRAELTSDDDRAATAWS